MACRTAICMERTLIGQLLTFTGKLRGKKRQRTVPCLRDMTDLQDKIAIVTGANSGMGMSTVEALSDKGATVIML